MKRHLAIITILGLLTSFLCGISAAQEEEETAYSWGTVKSITSKQIVVTEYDYDNDNEMDVTYTLDPNVKLYNVNSLKDIAIGSEIWIDYVVIDDENLALGIEVRQSSEEEYTPSQTYEEESEEIE